MLTCHINVYSSCSFYNRKFIKVCNSYPCCEHYGFHQRVYLLIGVHYVFIGLYWSLQEVIMILQTGVVFNGRLSLTQKERGSVTRGCGQTEFAVFRMSRLERVSQRDTTGRGSITGDQKFNAAKTNENNFLIQQKWVKTTNFKTIMESLHVLFH